MGIQAQRLSPEAAQQFFNTNSQFLYAAGLTDEELAQLDEMTMDGSGDTQMSTVNYNTNPFNADAKFPYQNQTNEMVAPQFKTSSGEAVTLKKPLRYTLKAKKPGKKEDGSDSSNICITQQDGEWAADGCKSIQFVSNVGDAVSLDDDEDEDEADATGCDCGVSTEITIVDDITGMFTNSNIDALWNPGALLNFEFWKSAMFYISLVITVLWILLALWGWRKDIRDKKLEDHKQQLEDKKQEEHKDEEKQAVVLE